MAMDFRPSGMQRRRLHINFFEMSGTRYDTKYKQWHPNRGEKKITTKIKCCDIHR